MNINIDRGLDEMVRESPEYLMEQHLRYQSHFNKDNRNSTSQYDVWQYGDTRLHISAVKGEPSNFHVSLGGYHYSFSYDDDGEKISFWKLSEGSTFRNLRDEDDDLIKEVFTLYYNIYNHFF
jgi:hypothetical protein